MTSNLVYNETKSFDLINIYRYVEENYDAYTLNSIKQYLKINKRIEKCKNDIFFATTCLQNNIMPNFTRFKTTNNRLRHQPIYLTCRKLILTTELSNHKTDLRKFIKSRKYLINNELFHIKTDDFNSIDFVLKKHVIEKFIFKTHQRTIKKLKNLKIAITTNDIIVNPIFINKSRNNLHLENTTSKFNPVFDLSKLLDQSETNLLSKGLKYGIKKNKFSQFEILSRFEEFAQKLHDENIVQKDKN